MLRSLRHSYLVLRLGLAFVFLWFGIDKFIHPQYWIDAWLPSSVVFALQDVGLSDRNLMYLNGIFEILVGTSLISTVFIRFFSVAAGVFLVSVMVFHGFNEILIRDIGLLGGLLAVALWPDRHFL